MKTLMKLSLLMTTLVFFVLMLSCSKDDGESDPIQEQPSRAPIAEFTVDTIMHELNDDFQFFDQSEFIPTNWLWTFSDGSTSTQQNPKKRFDAEGDYSVTLTVTNSFGSDSKVKVDYVTVGRYNTFKDPRDGEVYDIVSIGNQTWFAENLRTKLSGYSWSTNYGRLYEWGFGHHAIPDGWHIPSRSEWQQLISFLGGENVAGGKMKERGNDSWDAPNLGATNESFFTARAGGYRDYDPSGYYNQGTEVRFWVDEGSEPWVSYIALQNDESNITFGTMHTLGGCYYRLVKD